MALTIKSNPCNTGNYAKGRGGNAVKYIVIHYTANDGDTDEGNGKYFYNNDVNASAHYFVDENSATLSVQEKDTAWHCGDTQKYTNGGAWLKGKCKNSNSIGVEMCSDKRNGELVFTAETVVNTVELVKSLMKKHSVPLERVIRHYDVTGKKCPAPFVTHQDSWLRFKERLKG